MRYGSINLNYNRYLKLKNKFKIKTLNFSFSKKLILNNFYLYMYLPINWNFIFIKNKINFKFKNFIIYVYNDIYFFNMFVNQQFNYLYYDRQLNILKFNFLYNNNFYKTYWYWMKNLFYSFNLFFFKKIKFKGKGYYIFKNNRNTLVFQFGYSHKINIYFYYLTIKFLTKTSIMIFGLNKNELTNSSYQFLNIKKINIFTSKGIRFAKQIVYKKPGKISTYR